jgi:hypothetical protein
MASLPAFDGWADQYFCYEETKDYVLPNNRHATQYYHDHAVGITSENAYNGAQLQPAVLHQQDPRRTTTSAATVILSARWHRWCCCYELGQDHFNMLQG